MKEIKFGYWIACINHKKIKVGDFVDTHHGVYKVIKIPFKNWYKLKGQEKFLYHRSALKFAFRPIPTTHSKGFKGFKVKLNLFMNRIFSKFINYNGYYLDEQNK